MILDIEKRLQQILLKQDFYASKIRESSEYMLCAQGKRIRPLVVLSLLQDFGLDYKDYLDFAISIELIHTASLIHDDLPAIDNDDERRGKPSCHKKFGEAVAILTGDYLQALAFKTILEASLEPEKKNSLIHTLSRSFLDICLGQDLDITGSAELNLIHQLKTASLFQVCFEFALIIAGIEGEKKERLLRLGLEFGLYFQLKNDYADIYENLETGRAYSSDKSNQKHTIFNAENMSREEAESYLRQAKDSLQSLFKTFEGLDNLGRAISLK